MANTLTEQSVGNCKLFVGGLNWNTTTESLEAYFSSYGAILTCQLVCNQETGKSRGFAFITFESPASVDKVMKERPHRLDGRPIDPKPCDSKMLNLRKKGDAYKVFLGGLPTDVTENDLITFFSNYGNVVDVVIMLDEDNKACRGFGFLSFDTIEAVDKSCTDRFVHIKGRKVECKRINKNLANMKYGSAQSIYEVEKYGNQYAFQMMNMTNQQPGLVNQPATTSYMGYGNIAYPMQVYGGHMMSNYGYGCGVNHAMSPLLPPIPGQTPPAVQQNMVKTMKPPLPPPENTSPALGNMPGVVNITGFYDNQNGGAKNDGMSRMHNEKSSVVFHPYRR